AEGRQVELLTGGFYEPILAVLPDHDKFGQIERLTAFLKTHFGVRPRGMWLAERVWEPHLPRVLAEAGVEYVLVDDSHFALAGLDPDTLGGYYLTEDQGVRLRVFPISQRLRYLIPFAGVEASLEYLAARRGRVSAVTPSTPSSCAAASGATYSRGTPRWPTPTGRCSACQAPSVAPSREPPTTAASARRRSRSGGARPTTPTGTGCSAAAICRTSVGP